MHAYQYIYIHIIFIYMLRIQVYLAANSQYGFQMLYILYERIYIN